MKKILSFLAVAWLSILTCAAQNEWKEIIFTQATAAGQFNDSVFTAENSAFSFTCSDAANKLVVDANIDTASQYRHSQTAYVVLAVQRRGLATTGFATAS